MFTHVYVRPRYVNTTETLIGTALHHIKYHFTDLGIANSLPMFARVYERLDVFCKTWPFRLVKHLAVNRNSRTR